MKFGVRIPSIRKRIAARTSVKRYVRHSLGLKAPRGWGWLTNPRKAAYNRVYNRTTVGIKGCALLLGFFVGAVVITASVALAHLLRGEVITIHQYPSVVHSSVKERA